MSLALLFFVGHFIAKCLFFVHLKHLASFKSSCFGFVIAFPNSWFFEFPLSFVWLPLIPLFKRQHTTLSFYFDYKRSLRCSCSTSTTYRVLLPMVACPLVPFKMVGSNIIVTFSIFGKTLLTSIHIAPKTKTSLWDVNFKHVEKDVLINFQLFWTLSIEGHPILFVHLLQKWKVRTSLSP